VLNDGCRNNPRSIRGSRRRSSTVMNAAAAATVMRYPAQARGDAQPDAGAFDEDGYQDAHGDGEQCLAGEVEPPGACRAGLGQEHGAQDDSGDDDRCVDPEH